MKTDRKQKSGRIRSLIYLYVLLVLLSLFSVATYTWFSLSRTPEVSDLALYVNSPHGLELSEDPMAEEWKLQLDFSKLVDKSVPLRPITWSNKDNRFYSVRYGVDGRLLDVAEPLNDERNANKENADGYYIKSTFYARSDQKATVSLSSAVEVEQGTQGSGTFVIGKPIWNVEEVAHENGGHGAEFAVRIGILVEKTDLMGQLKNDPAEFYIYEPNCDGHPKGEQVYVSTPSIDGVATLVPEDHLILQSNNSWAESVPVQNGVVVHDLGEFTTDTELFTLNNDELAKISLYIWIEGQDVDCTNAIGHEAEILANIQFAATMEGQSGMVPVN